jgi:hypothetical protein
VLLSSSFTGSPRLSVFRFGVEDTVERLQSACVPTCLRVCVPACLRVCVPAVCDSIEVVCALGTAVSLRDLGVSVLRK